MMPDGLIDETVEVPTISGATPPDEITTRLLEIKGMSYQPFAWADTLNQGVADIPARMNAIEQQLAALTGAASYEADTLIGVRDSVSQPVVIGSLCDAWLKPNTSNVTLVMYNGTSVYRADFKATISTFS